jgi:hypothetical protein
MTPAISAFQQWLLLRAPDGTAATLPGNLTRAFEADDVRLLPVFVAHAWQEHLQSELHREHREAAEAEQRRLEAAFHARLGLHVEGDRELALELGRAVDCRLLASRCFLHLSALPMPDGRRWLRLEIGDSTDLPVAASRVAEGWRETVQVIAVASRCQAEAITEGLREVLSARGFQASADQGLFHLEGPQLVALVAILRQLALPESEVAAAMPG